MQNRFAVCESCHVFGSVRIAHTRAHIKCAFAARFRGTREGRANCIRKAAEPSAHFGAAPTLASKRPPNRPCNCIQTTRARVSQLWCCISRRCGCRRRRRRRRRLSRRLPHRDACAVSQEIVYVCVPLIPLIIHTRAERPSTCVRADVCNIKEPILRAAFPASRCGVCVCLQY